MNNHEVFGVCGKEIFADTLLHAGEVPGEERGACGMSQRKFTGNYGQCPPVLNGLIKDKRNISALPAMKIEETLKISANNRMRLPMRFDLDIAGKQLKVA